MDRGWVLTRSREEIAEDLVRQPRRADELLEELKSYPWDCEEELVTLTPEMLSWHIRSALDGHLPVSLLHDWASAVDGRDDIGMGGTIVRQAIFELAIPELNGALTPERLLVILHGLSPTSRVE